MASPRTLKNITHITSLRLGGNDVRFIKELITLSRKLRKDFVFSDKVGLALTDILLINAEDQQAVDFYAKHRRDMHCVPVFVCPRKVNGGTCVPDTAQYPNARTLSTPVRLAELGSVLLDIVSTPQESTKPALAPHKKGNSFKMLVVDDSFPVRKYLQEKLPLLMADIDQDLDFDIQYAGSGREAVAKVKEARGAYDMVFLDIMMDDIDGYRICKWIKKVKSSINVVMLTSKSSPVDRVRGKLAGCDNYLSKPPKDSNLKKVILKHKKFEFQQADSSNQTLNELR